MKNYVTIPKWFAVVTIVLLSIPSHAQDKFSFSIKAGLGIPTQNLGDTEIKPGFGYEGVIGYQMTSLLSVYAGWSHQFFSADEPFAGLNLDFEETGYNAGIQFTYPAQPGEVQYAMSVGLLYNHIEAEGSNGDILADSGHELGAQIEGLVAIPLSETLYIIPFARYRMLDTDLTVNEVTIPTNLNYIGIGTGIKWTF